CRRQAETFPLSSPSPLRSEQRSTSLLARVVLLQPSPALLRRVVLPAPCLLLRCHVLSKSVRIASKISSRRSTDDDNHSAYGWPRRLRSSSFSETKTSSQPSAVLQPCWTIWKRAVFTAVMRPSTISLMLGVLSRSVSYAPRSTQALRLSLSGKPRNSIEAG